ncbi:hypothetical protein QBC44DRAFT_313736 [Cladorrhinum sp. PSN332]|nr:hypothetical protein QBC44DRAFT_313736 [Cladorrhinum sp. PSN332]
MYLPVVLVAFASNFLLTVALPLPQDATAVAATAAGSENAVPNINTPVPVNKVSTDVNACATANGGVGPAAVTASGGKDTTLEDRTNYSRHSCSSFWFICYLSGLM